MPCGPIYSPICTAIFASALFAAGTSASRSAEVEVLLTGTSTSSDGAARPFVLSGESREEVVGGEVKLGDASYRIDRVSRMNLIGARREGGSGGGAEFAVFSSSFSDQTATGDPWVAADRYVGCAEAYNSFLAVYRVGAGQPAAVAEVPYADLTTSLDHSDDATVYCFISRPPGA